MEKYCRTSPAILSSASLEVLVVVICVEEGRRQGMLQVSKQAKTLAAEKLWFFLLLLFFTLPFFLKEVLAFLQAQGAQMER